MVAPLTRRLTRVGKIATSHDNQSKDPLSLRERAGVRVKRLNTHQPTAGTSLVVAPLTRRLTRVGKIATSHNNQSPDPLSLRERAGVRVKCLNTHQPTTAGTSLVVAPLTRRLTRVGKIATSHNNQSPDPLSLRERAGVRVKCINTHQPTAGTSVVVAPLTRRLTRVGKIATNHNNQSKDPLSLRERAGVRVKRLNTHQPTAGTSVVVAPLTRRLTRVGKIATSHDNQSKDPLSLRERAGVRVKRLSLRAVEALLLCAVPDAFC